jgi:hypothetical protein
LSGGRSGLRKQHNCDCRKAQQNADEEAKFKEGGLRSGFLFHWMKCGLSDAFADTLAGVSAWMSPGLVIFPQVTMVERPCYLNPQTRVNTILTCFGRSSMPDARTQTRDQLKFYGHL